MKKITAAKFKAHCLAVISQVKATGEPVLITEKGNAIVKLVPAEDDKKVFGFMAGEFEIAGDIESPRRRTASDKRRFKTAI